MYCNNNQVIVGVFGSKPDPIIPDVVFDKVYAANAALEQAQQHHYCSKVSVLSGYVFSANSECLKCWEHIRECQADFVHVVNSNATSEQDIEDRIRSELRVEGFDIVEPWSRIRLITKVLGWRAALSIVNSSPLVFRCRDFFRIIRGTEPRSLRVSTGVYALCYAIEQSESARPTYYVIGIGVEGGTGHFYDKGIIYPNFHRNADLKVLLELKKKLGKRLVVTDEDARDLLK